MTCRYLSHIYKTVIPAYGKSASLNVSAVRSLAGGDTANIYSFTLENHWGTHMDAPNHFFVHGRKISEYEPSFLFFRSPQVIALSLKPCEILTCGDWIKTVRHDTDLLLFQSGWGAFREQNIYCCENPGIHPDVGFYLRKNFPSLKSVGMDWLSISSYQNRPLGREAHRAFLNPDGEGEPVLIVEDMDLSMDLRALQSVHVAPLRMEMLDSAPCTVIGSFGD